MQHLLKRVVLFLDRETEIFDRELLMWSSLVAFIGPLAVGTVFGVAMETCLVGSAGIAFAFHMTVSEWRCAADRRKLRRKGAWSVPIDTDGFSSYPPKTDMTQRKDDKKE